MDSFFDGSILKFIVPILMIILFSLPDTLRKRRKYPTRKRRPAPMPRQYPKDEQTIDMQTAEEETIPEIARPRKPERTYAAPVSVSVVPASTAVKIERTAPVEPTDVPHIVHGEPWSELAPEARDIYAGLVWSELLEPPISRRRRRY